MDSKEFIFNTVLNTGVSGFESSRAKFLVDEFSKYCDEVTIDTLGNVIALKKGNGKGKIMYMAHMDEIGLMITDIDKKGLLSFTKIGGVDGRTLVAQEVVILGKEKVTGVIGVKPPHLTSDKEAKEAPKIDKLKIDTGLDFDKVNELIEVSDVAIIKREPIELLNNRIAINGLDDAVGIGAMYEAMKRLKDIKHEVDVYFVASIQEEVTGIGATTVTRQIKPDIAVAIDVTFAKTPELSNINIELGKGPTLTISPTNHRQVFKAHKEILDSNNIPYQINVSNKSLGTDSNNIELAVYDVAVADIGIPLRYMHTSVEVVDLNDVLQTGRLISSFVQSFNEVLDMEGFLCY